MSAIRAESAILVQAAGMRAARATPAMSLAAIPVPLAVRTATVILRAAILIQVAVTKAVTSSAALLAMIPAALLIAVIMAALLGTEEKALPATGAVSAAVHMAGISARRIPAGMGASARPIQAGMEMQIHRTPAAAGRHCGPSIIRADGAAKIERKPLPTAF